MRLMGTPIDRAGTLGELGHVQQARGLHDLARGMQPCRSIGLPRTLDRQGTDDQAHAAAGRLDLAVMLAQPGANDLGVVPGGLVPHQQHGALAAALPGGARQDNLGAPRPSADAQRGVWFYSYLQYPLLQTNPFKTALVHVGSNILAPRTSGRDTVRHCSVRGLPCGFSRRPWRERKPNTMVGTQNSPSVRVLLALTP